MNLMVLYCTIDMWHIKRYIFVSGCSKKAIFLTFDHFSHSMWSSNIGHEHEKGGHMNPIVLYWTIDLWHIKTYIFLDRKLKKGNVFKFDHFSYSMWSSNSGHEPEKGGHMNPMVLYCTIDLWHIKTYNFLVRKFKKGNVFKIWPLFTLHVGIKLWSWAWRRW